MKIRSRTTKRINRKVKALNELTSHFLFIEYYTHTKQGMFKILNEYTKFKEEKLVLCFVTDGIEKALDIAIEYISEKEKEYILYLNQKP